MFFGCLDRCTDVVSVAQHIRVLWDKRRFSSLAAEIADSSHGKTDEANDGRSGIARSLVLERVMNMDLGSVEDISAFQAATTRQRFDMTVLKKTLEISKAQGQAAIELIESATEITDQDPSHGNRKLDVTI